MVNEKELMLVRVSSATAYTFRIPNGHLGWAICTINDHTNELSIQSDWGSWSYRWGGHFGANGGRVQTLTDFIGDRRATWKDHAGVEHFDCYIADKLTSGRPYNDPEGRSVYSHEKTVRRFGWHIAEARRNDYITREEHIAFARELAELKSSSDCEGSAEEFLRRWYAIDKRERVGSDCYEWIQTEDTGAYRVLSQMIIPALVRTLRSVAAAARGATASEGECAYA